MGRGWEACVIRVVVRQVLRAEDGWLLKGDSLHARDMMIYVPSV